MDSIPLAFHKVSGKNASISSDGLEASRKPGKSGNAYVFTKRIVKPGETIFIKVLSMDEKTSRGMTFGMTSCDPSKLKTSSLPYDVHMLNFRPEFWTYRTNLLTKKMGDIFSFHYSDEGVIRCKRNDEDPLTLRKVNANLPVRAFFEISGNSRKIMLLGVDFFPKIFFPLLFIPREDQSLTSDWNNSLLTDNANQRVSQVLKFREFPDDETLRVDSEPPPVPPPRVPPRNKSSKTRSEYLPRSRNPTSPDDLKFISECCVCIDKVSDCAFVPCGHVCTCHACAQKLELEGSPKCPMCRKEIEQVLRIYNS